jgi:hypothetical protein
MHKPEQKPERQKEVFKQFNAWLAVKLFNFSGWLMDRTIKKFEKLEHWEWSDCDCGDFDDCGDCN